jgi:EAL domain-containing protein (putative c-di-GMP-specific phosphodiesterase class I)
MAEQLGFSVVAEWVEQQSELQFLAAIFSCNFYMSISAVECRGI